MPNKYGTRNDGTDKGTGYWGEIYNDAGDVMTELSIGVEIDGQEQEIPTLVPTLNSGEIRQLQALKDGEPIPEAIVQKAIKHAVLRKQHGQSVWADEWDNILIPDMRKSIGIK